MVRKKKEIPVCQDCLTSDLNRIFYKVISNKHSSHYFISCDKCVETQGYKEDKDYVFDSSMIYYKKNNK
jgi:hypothetical protein